MPVFGIETWCVVAGMEYNLSRSDLWSSIGCTTGNSVFSQDESRETLFNKLTP